MKLLEEASKYDPLFIYVPEFYLETTIDSFHALRRGDPPLAMTEEQYLPGLISVISFLIKHFTDKRVINPDVRDILLQSLSVLLQYADYVRAFENPSIDQKAFMRSLLQSFDARFWGSISNILLRFWKGTGFGQISVKKDNSSEIFQKVFRDACLDDLPLLNEFLNIVFNNINWALTEFDIAAKELQKIMNQNRYAIELQQVQRRTNQTFDIAVSLFSMVEFISMEVPEVFLSPSQEMNSIRLAEFLLFALIRTTTGPDSKIIDSLTKIPALDKVNRFNILRPCAGIIIHLFKPHLKKDDFLSFAKIFAANAGYDPEILKFLVDFDWKQGTTDSEKSPDYSRLSLITEFGEECEKETQITKQKETNMVASSSAEFCSICCSAIIDTQFEPCKHTSCSMCIKRQLLNSEKCFFCNAKVVSIHDINQ